MELVVAQLVLNKEENKNTTGKASRKPKDVDGRKNLVLPKIAQGNQEIIPDHTAVFKEHYRRGPITIIGTLCKYTGSLHMRAITLFQY